MRERTPNLTRIKEGVIAEIKWLAKRGDPLNISAVKRSHPKLIEVVFSVRPFWGWKQALEDAGLDYGKIRVELTETVECRECGVRQLRLQHHLGSAHDLTTEAYSRRYPSAAIFAEKWQAETYPLTTAIPDFPHWEPLWTSEYVLDRLHHMHARGIPLHSTAIQKSEPAMLPIAIRFFGAWDTALELAGVPVEDIRRRQAAAPRDAESLIAFIKERSEAGKPINYKSMQTDHPGVLCAIRDVFGDYSSALKAAGFDLSAVKRRGGMVSVYPTGESILEEIRRRHAAGKKLNAASLAREEDGDVALHSRAMRVFGSWGKALAAAGVDPDEVSSWKYRTPDSVLKAIRTRIEAGIHPAAKFVLKGEHADTGLYGGSIRHFGGWMKALQAVGVQYRPTRRKAAYQTAEEVLVAIRKRHSDGLPLAGATLRTGEHVDWALYGSGERLFGNWADAVHAALPELPLLPRRRRDQPEDPEPAAVPAQEVRPAVPPPAVPPQSAVPPQTRRYAEQDSDRHPAPPLLPQKWREGMSERKAAPAPQDKHHRHAVVPPAAKPQPSLVPAQWKGKHTAKKQKAPPPPPPVPPKEPGIPQARPKPPPLPVSKPGDAPTTMEDLIRNMGLGD